MTKEQQRRMENNEKEISLLKSSLTLYAYQLSLLLEKFRVMEEQQKPEGKHVKMQVLR